MLKKIANHSEPYLKMNLQFFSDDLDDFILPDKGEPTPPEVEEAPVEETTPPEVEETTEETEGMSAEQKAAFLKVKYNKEELELDEDKARELAQMGLNYPKLQEKLKALESDPRLSFVEELAKGQGMEVNEYLEAVRQHREEQKLNELIQQNIPEDIAKEMLEMRKFREQVEAEKKAKSAEQKQTEEFGEFLSFFEQANSRDFNPDSDQIPPEVWEAHSKGVPLKYAYLEHHNNQLASQLKVLKQNETNKKKAPVGSVTAHGSTETASDDDFLKGFNSI